MIIDFKIFKFYLKTDFFILKKFFFVITILITLVIFICMKYKYLYIGIIFSFIGYTLIRVNKIITKQAYGINFNESLKFFTSLNKYITRNDIDLLKKELLNYETFEEKNNFNIIFTELLYSNSFNNNDIYNRLDEVKEMIEIIKKNKLK